VRLIYNFDLSEVLGAKSPTDQQSFVTPSRRLSAAYPLAVPLCITSAFALRPVFSLRARWTISAAMIAASPVYDETSFDHMKQFLRAQD
jgi:hypothetical protein